MKTKHLLFILCLCASSVAMAQSDSVKNTVSGRKYPIVRIGTQVWMAENVADSVYDTESEAFGDTIPDYEHTENSDGTTPYYYDGRRLTGKSDRNLTDSLRQRLGLTYNWASVMGYRDGRTASDQCYEQENDRQGICPNGYHVPKQDEIKILYNYVTKNPVALMDSLGWYKKAGNNFTGFGLLPAGYYYQDYRKFVSIGEYTRLHTATPNKEYSGSQAFLLRIDMDTTTAEVTMEISDGSKRSTSSCRCLKNAGTVDTQTPHSNQLMIFAKDGRIFCEAEEFSIYDLIGRNVTKLNGRLKGIYIVKADNKTQKIILQ